MDHRLPSLKAYLIEAKKYNTPDIKAVVFGNTSADMDSVVGSMCMSWYYGMKGDVKYTPVIYCKKADLLLRIEIMEHLALFGIDEAFLHEHVIFSCDFDKKH